MSPVSSFVALSRQSRKRWGWIARADVQERNSQMQGIHLTQLTPVRSQQNSMFHGDILCADMLLSLRIPGTVEFRVVRAWEHHAKCPFPSRGCNSSSRLPDSPTVLPFTPHFGIITAGGEQEVCPHVFNYLKCIVILTLQCEVKLAQCLSQVTYHGGIWGFM